ncbi:hypothetical protein ACFW3Y_29605 [Streptomyces rochei]|uniref:hypothetical protein n=1 Tax=Streptomyces rochei TaxID=1928 RepID=UPI00367844E8
MCPGELLADFYQDLDPVGGPEDLVLLGRRTADADLAARTGAHQGAGDGRQSQAEGIARVIVDEPEQIGGGRLPVADLGPEPAAFQFVGERGQGHDLARAAAAGEAFVDAGAVGLADSGMQQGGRVHERGVDLPSGGRVVGLVGEEQVHTAGGLLRTVVGHVGFLLQSGH